MDSINFKEFFSVTLILFSVIDILGSIPFIIDLKKKYKKLDALKITIISGVLLYSFLFIGQSILSLFGVDVESFAVAGGIIMFFLGLEMVLNIEIFKHDPQLHHTSPIVPLAFPLIAGAGSMTTLISLNAEYEKVNIILGIFLNLIFVYLVLRTSDFIDRKLGITGSIILRKFFGTILLAMAIRLIKKNFVGI
ncbi:MAG: MarC family protein [Bdellovibrionales bacterium]|nr:MarC family protein [Bdellovibrionales bacterium]